MQLYIYVLIYDVQCVSEWNVIRAEYKIEVSDGKDPEWYCVLGNGFDVEDFLFSITNTLVIIIIFYDDRFASPLYILEAMWASDSVTRILL